MALIYATAADLTAWSQAAAPPNADQLLRAASRLVRKTTATAFYATDPAGLPTDPDTLAAFRDATTAQATFWALNSIDPATGGLAQAGVLNRKQIGSASLAYDTVGVGSVTAYQNRVAAAGTLCDEAVDILQQAGINLNFPWITG